MGKITTYLAAEDANFTSVIEKSTGQFRRLVASLDPAAAATDRFNKSQQALDNALKRSRVSVEQHAELTRRLKASYDATTGAQTMVTANNGRMRAGMQQLSYQIGDVSQGLALGTKAQVIFAQQSGQVIQAIQLMAGGTSKLAMFLGGGWGIALASAAVVLTPLIANLFEAADASSDAADGVDKFVEALKRLQDQGGAFKFGSEEFAKVSKGVLEAEAKAAQLRKELSGTSASFTVLTPGATGPVSGGRSREAIAQELAAAEATAKNLRGDLNVLLMQRKNRDYLDRPAADKSGGGSGSSRSSRGGAADRTDQIETRFQADLRAAHAQQLQDELAITTDIDRRRELQADLNQLEYEQRAAQIANEKDYTKEQRAALMELLRKRYGIIEGQDNGIVVSKPSPFSQAIDNKYFDEQLQQKLQLDSALLDIQASQLRGQLDAARTQDERRRIQLELLANDTELARLTLEAIKKKSDSNDIEKQIAQKKLDNLNAETAQRASAIERNTMGPLAAYFDQLPKGAAELNEAFQKVAVDGLQSVNDGLVDAITGAKSLGDVFKNVANQIIADLLRIQLQKAITNGLSGVLGGLFGGGGGLGGIASVAASVVPSGTVKTGIKLPGFAHGGEIPVGGMPGIDRNLLSINGNPRAWVSDTETLRVANDRGGSQAQRPVEVLFAVEPGSMFVPTVAAASGAVATRQISSAEARARRKAGRKMGLGVR